MSDTNAHSGASFISSARRQRVAFSGAMSYDLIALGETMLALAPAPGETLQSAATLQVDHAGAESNTCVGLARLGLRVAWISRLGDDPPESLYNLGIIEDQSGNSKRAYDLWVTARAKGVKTSKLDEWIDAKKRIYGY